MRDHPALRSYDQAHTPRLEDAQTVRWGSVAAHEAVERICHEVALRCQRIIDMYGSAAIPEENEHHQPRGSGSTTPRVVGTLDADTTLPVRVHPQVPQPGP